MIDVLDELLDTKFAIQSVVDFLLNNAAKGTHQEAQLDIDGEEPLLNLNTSADTAALELQRVPMPVPVDIEPLGELFGEMCHSMARFLQIEAMRTLDSDACHG